MKGFLRDAIDRLVELAAPTTKETIMEKGMGWPSVLQ